jgi:putative ABC transport system substrate-binding protein
MAHRQPFGMWRVAVLHHGSPASGTLARLRQGLHRGGLIEGVHCVVDAEGAEGVWERLPHLVEQLLSRAPDVIVAIGAIAALAAQRATAQVPILHAIVLDPADIGLTASNVTGVTTFDPDQAGRHLQLLSQLVPGLRSVAVVADADAPSGPDGINPLLARCLRAATTAGLQTTCISLSGRHGELEDGLERARLAQAQAVVALEVPAVLARLGDIVRLAEAQRLPTLSPHGGPDTGLVMQGAALHDATDALVAQVTALFHGACVAELPLRTVRHERLVIHGGRARRIGLGIPGCLLERATMRIDDEPNQQAVARR